MTQTSAGEMSLFDPRHIPTLLPRIRRLSELIVASNANANSLTASDEIKREDGPQGAGKSDNFKASPSPDALQGPNVALGASTDDDDATAGYETALSISFHNTVGDGSGNIKPSALAQSLVRESMGLRDAFADARRAIDTLEGADMDIEEQERLITVLESYAAIQE